MKTSRVYNLTLRILGCLGTGKKRKKILSNKKFKTYEKNFKFMYSTNIIPIILRISIVEFVIYVINV